jgi:hypothetical protein
MKYSYLETRSHWVNTSFIILAYNLSNKFCKFLFRLHQILMFSTLSLTLISLAILV